MIIGMCDRQQIRYMKIGMCVRYSKHTLAQSQSIVRHRQTRACGLVGGTEHENIGAARGTSDQAAATLPLHHSWLSGNRLYWQID